MTVRRGFLYLGVFLLAIGGVTLLGEAGTLDRGRVAAALALWPVVVIALGLGLLLRRTPAGLPAGVLAAAAPGLLLGGLLVAGPDLGWKCGDLEREPARSVTHDGSFGGTAEVDVALSCGELDVTTLPGSAWRLDVQDGGERETTVLDEADRLSVDSEGRRTMRWDASAVRWNLGLPTGSRLDLDVTVNAGRGRLDLADLQLDSLAVDLNAGDVQVDLTGADVGRIDVGVNAGAATLTLPEASDLTGDINVNAGSLEMCVPDELGLRVRGETTLGSTDFNGLSRRGDAWETPGYDSARYHAELSVSASVGSVDINPEGGCK